jgi:hypothetical protein
MFVVHGQADADRRTGPIGGGRGEEALLSRPELRELLDRAGWLRPDQLSTVG